MRPQFTIPVGLSYCRGLSSSRVLPSLSVMEGRDARLLPRNAPRSLLPLILKPFVFACQPCKSTHVNLLGPAMAAGVTAAPRLAVHGAPVASRPTGAGSGRTGAGPAGHARRRTRDTAPRRGIDGAAPARPPAGPPGPADAPPGVAWLPPRQGAGNPCRRADPGGHARRRMRRIARRRGSARVLGGFRGAGGAARGCGWRGLPGRGGRRAAPSGKSGTPAGGTGNRIHGRSSGTV